MEQAPCFCLVASGCRPIPQPSRGPFRRWIRLWTCLGCLHDILHQGMATIQSQLGCIASVWTLPPPLIQLLILSFHLACISYVSSFLFPQFLPIFLEVLPPWVYWPQCFSSIVTKNLIWLEPPLLMPIWMLFDQSILVCRVQPLHTPSQRVYSCLVSSGSSLNGSSLSADISAFLRLPSASAQYLSPW